MPAYNAARTLERAFASLRAQTHPAAEVIVVDDGSSDDTRERAHRLRAADARIRVLAQARNAGPAAARNAGLAAASGTWVAFIDADDAWRPDRLERLLARAGDEADAVFDNLVGFDADRGTETGPLFPHLPAEGIGFRAMLAASVPGSPLNFGYLKPLVRRDFLERHGLRFDETLRTSEDLLFFLGLIGAGARTATVPTAHYVYTLPVGPESGRASPHSHSVPRDREVAAALARLRAAPLSREDAVSLEARIAGLRAVAPVSDFYFARRQRRFGTMLSALVRFPAVRREVGRVLYRRLGRTFHRKLDRERDGAAS